MTPAGKGLYLRDPHARKPATALGLLADLACDWALVNVAYPATCRAVAARFPTFVYALPEKFDDGLGSGAIDEWRGTALRLARVADEAGGAGVCLNLERGWAAATRDELRDLDLWLRAESKRRPVMLVTHDGLRKKFSAIAAACSLAGVIVSPECYSHQISASGDGSIVAHRIEDWRAAGWAHVVPAVASIPAPRKQNDPIRFALFYQYAQTAGSVPPHTAAIWPVSMSSASRKVMRQWRP